MTRRTTSFLLIVAAAVLYACATTANFDDYLNSWVGRDGNKLASAGWGALDQVKQLPNGNSEHVYLPVAGKTIADKCLAIFEVDGKTGRIVHVRHKGGQCKMVKPK